MTAAETLTAPNKAARLAELERGTTTAAALEFFDSLPAAPVEMVTGPWRGSVLATGHALDGLLDVFGWHGKRFGGPEEVHPLVMKTTEGKLFSINPVLMPVGLMLRYAGLLKRPRIARILRASMRLFSTNRPQARLRMIEHRGVVTSAMIYDRQPINDVFRKVDDDTLLGVMDLRGVAQPFFFIVKRE